MNANLHITGFTVKDNDIDTVTYLRDTADGKGEVVTKGVGVAASDGQQGVSGGGYDIDNADVILISANNRGQTQAHYRRDGDWHDGNFGYSTVTGQGYIRIPAGKYKTFCFSKRNYELKDVFRYIFKNASAANFLGDGIYEIADDNLVASGDDWTLNANESMALLLFRLD